MLLRHTFIYAVGRGAPGVLNFLAIAIYTRMLSPDDYGRYALIIATVALCNTFLFEWLRLGLLRFFAAHADRPRALLATLLTGFVTMAAVATLGAAVATAALWDGTGAELIVLGLVLLAAQAWFELNLELARAQFSPGRYCLMEALRAAIGLGGGVLLIAAGFGAVGPVLGLLVALVVAIALCMPRLWFDTRPALIERRLLHDLLWYGLPLTASLALNFVVSLSDRFLIGWLLGVEATGVYAAGYDLVWHTLTMLMMLVNLAGYPLVVRALENEGVEACRRQVRQNVVLLLAIALPAAAGIAVCAPTIASVALGEAFRDAAGALLPWVAAGAVIARLKGYYVDLSFHLGRKTVLQVWIMLAAAALNVGLNLWWIPVFGVLGAVYATIAAYALAFGLGVILGRRAFALPPPPPESLKIVLVTAVMVAALWPFRGAEGALALLGQTTLGGGVYVLGLLLLDVAGCRRMTLGFIADRLPFAGAPNR